jgi:DNA (cytosine-5)-methyltransferase 1
MTHGSLFSGIGGFDLAAEWMGWENVFHCELAEFPSKILKHHWPNTEHYADITKTDFTKWRGKVDVLSGGFPCQPFSQAGKRKGTADTRYLWPEMLRVIREVRPRWVVGENVYGLVNWDGGVVLDTVCADLENEGFKILPVILPACAVNAPHQRQRIWFVAYSFDGGYSSGRKASEEKNGVQGIGGQAVDTWKFDRASVSPITPDTDSNGIQGFATNNRASKKIRQGGTSIKEIRHFEYVRNWQDFPTQSPVCSRDDGFSSRLDGITFPKWRSESIKAYGNAVVPQVVYEIFKTIDLYEMIYG